MSGVKFLPIVAVASCIEQASHSCKVAASAATVGQSKRDGYRDR
jgi:hypothetical protein